MVCKMKLLIILLFGTTLVLTLPHRKNHQNNSVKIFSRLKRHLNCCSSSRCANSCSDCSSSCSSQQCSQPCTQTCHSRPCTRQCVSPPCQRQCSSPACQRPCPSTPCVQPCPAPPCPQPCPAPPCPQPCPTAPCPQPCPTASCPSPPPGPHIPGSNRNDSSSISVQSRDDKKDDSKVDVTSVMNITNQVNNLNNISVPIVINNRNELHTSHKSDAQHSSTSSRDREIINKRKTSVTVPQSPIIIRVPYPVHRPVHIPVPVPRPIPVPVHIPRPVPYPVPVPIPIPIQRHPCYGINCHVVRPFFHREICDEHQQCSVHQQDCSGCGSDFYLNEHSYNSCYGCFL